MALDSSSVSFLCAARSLGVDFSTTGMIGRQAFSPGPATLRQVFVTHGIDRNADAFVRNYTYAEEFFRVLGAREISSLDGSPYENASIESAGPTESARAILLRARRRHNRTRL